LPTLLAHSVFQSRSAQKSRAIQRISQSTYSQCDCFLMRSPYGPAAIFAPVNALPSATLRARSIIDFSLSYRSRRLLVRLVHHTALVANRRRQLGERRDDDRDGFFVTGIFAIDASKTTGVVVSSTHSSSSSDSAAAAAAASFARFASAAFAAAPL
jgi:hypothetical protein